MHTESHPLAGKTVYLNSIAEDPIQGQVVYGAEYTIEDWWDLLTGGSWMDANGNFAAMHYAVRSALSRAQVPTDDEVVYGKITRNSDGFPVSLGHLVHVSELGEAK